MLNYRVSRKAAWLIGTSTVYVIISILDFITFENLDHLPVIQLIWIIALSLPLWIKPLHKVIFTHR